jgi:hypothetical protein
MRRTTVVAKEEDLAVLEHDARARGISLGRALGEAVALRAEDLRRNRRPQLGVFSAEASIAELAESENPADRAFRSE